jgi:hypothetical protein
MRQFLKLQLLRKLLIFRSGARVACCRFVVPPLTLMANKQPLLAGARGVRNVTVSTLTALGGVSLQRSAEGA